MVGSGDTMPFDSSTWVPAGHYYSPLADPSDPHVQSILTGQRRFDVDSAGDSLVLDDSKLFATLECIHAAYALMDFPELPTPGFRYYFANPAFSYPDAIAYFGLLYSLRPKRVIEVGSGFSSCLLMDANDRVFHGVIAPSFIDPYPETLQSLLAEDDPYRSLIIDKSLQDVPTDFFRELRENDILFIDSSHVVKIGSDVCDYLFRVLPALRSGVVIHIHDIFYPFEYGADWIVEENRSWNEAYALRAFLQYNNKFEIIYFCHYMHTKHFAMLEATPLAQRNPGGSLWLRKK